MTNNLTEGCAIRCVGRQALGWWQLPPRSSKPITPSRFSVSGGQSLGAHGVYRRGLSGEPSDAQRPVLPDQFLGCPSRHRQAVSLAGCWAMHKSTQHDLVRIHKNCAAFPHQKGKPGPRLQTDAMPLRQRYAQWAQRRPGAATQVVRTWYCHHAIIKHPRRMDGRLCGNKLLAPAQRALWSHGDACQQQWQQEVFGDPVWIQADRWQAVSQTNQPCDARVCRFLIVARHGTAQPAKRTNSRRHAVHSGFSIACWD